MSWKVKLPFVCFFLFILYSVGIFQAIVEIGEYRKSEEKQRPAIQFLDVFYDTFITPIKRKNEIASLFAKLEGKISDLGKSVKKKQGSKLDEFWYSYTAEQNAEEALFCVQDIRKAAVKINRHKNAKEEGLFFETLDSVYEELDDLYATFQDEEKVSIILEKVDAAVKRVSTIGALYGKTKLAEIPGLVFAAFLRHTVFSSKYLRAYQSEMEESSIVANTLRPPMQFIRYCLVHDVGDKAILGRNGWFFYKPGFDYLVRPYMRDPRSIVVDYNDVAMSENPLEAIATFKNQLEERDIELLVAIVPGKPTMYPDMLNKNVDPQIAGTAAMTHSIRAMKDLEALGVQCVNLFEPFHKERQRDAEAGDSMYLRMDTHWRARGLRLAAKTIANRIREFPWYSEIANEVEYVLDTVTVDRVGDVGVMTTLPAFKIFELGMSFAVEPTLCYQVYKVRRDTAGNEIGRSLFRDDYRRSKILVLGDSFSRIYQTDDPRSAGWISHLAYELGVPMASIVSDGGASTLVRQTLSRKKGVLRGKKLVVWEFIERDFRYGAEGWKDVEL